MQSGIDRPILTEQWPQKGVESFLVRAYGLVLPALCAAYWQASFSILGVIGLFAESHAPKTSRTWASSTANTRATSQAVSGSSSSVSLGRPASTAAMTVSSRASSSKEAGTVRTIS
jgi:hypothetical protein